MFAEVFKKDSLQDEEYAECYVFDKTMLLSKTDLESYSTCDYDENSIIRNFHQKQSSYAQSEGYHSYVSSNDSAIIAQFADRSQLENDIASVEESICSSKDCGISGDCRSSIDAGKLHNTYNSCNVKGASYERCNSQHIAHSARVQTPQRHYSESVQYSSTRSGLGSASGAPIMPTKPYYQQSCSNDRPDQKHGSSSAINSQLRKLYPVNTYCIQPNSCPNVVASSYSKVCDSNLNVSKLPSCSKKSFFESENMQCTKQNELCGARATAEYTFLDPSKQRVVSNQNLKHIQKQALISYYERHHSTWRSEPQLSTNSSTMSVPQSRPRMPSPTSCHYSLCLAQNEECIDTDTDKNLTSSIAIPHMVDASASDHPANITGHIPESGSYINNRWKFTTTTTTTKITQQCTSTQLGIPFDEERVPELPPKKNHLNLQTTARRLSSPDLPPPPPSPPAVLDDEVYVPDEPFPPPPMAACEETSGAASALICDIPKVPDDLKSIAYGETPIKCTPSKIDSKLRTRTRTNSMYESSTSKFSKSSRIVANDDADQRCGPQQPPPGFVSRRVATAVKCIDDGKINCGNSFSMRKPANVSRLSSSSFRTYKRSVSESMMPTVEKFPIKMSVQPSPSSVTLCDNANRTKLPSHVKADAPSNAGSNHIEQKVKAIRTLFEDTLKKSNFQFPSFSFIHSEKFPYKLDPRFPRTSYQLSQSSNHREFRDCEKGEIFNAVGIYKRTTSPLRSVNDYDNVTSGVVINDSQTHQHQAQTQPQSPPYSKRSPIVEPLPSSIHNHDIALPPLNTIEHSPSCYRAIPPLTTNVLLPNTILPPLPSPTLSLTAISPVTEEDRIFTALRVSANNVEVTECVDEQSVAHYLLQSNPQDICERANVTDDFGPILPLVQPRSQSISPSEQFVKNVTSTNPSNDSVLRLRDDISHSTDNIDDTRGGLDCHRVAAIPVLIEEDDSFDIANSKNMANTIDAASQTDVNVQTASPPQVPPLPSMSRNTQTSIFENEIEKLRIELMDELTPTNRLYKILQAAKSNSKTPTDYLENILDHDVVLPISIMQKNLSRIRQSQDTRLQEGSISYGECVFQLSQEMKTKLDISENCDNFQNMTRCTTGAPTTTTTLNTAVSIIQEKKNTLVKYLTRQLDTLKLELDTISQESRKNEEQGVVIWQQIMHSLSARDASKYKLHFQEVGQITSLLLGLGARLAKVENALQDLPGQPESQTEKKILENRKSQLVQQLVDAKELKKDIDKRSALLTSLLHKYFNQQQINQYHQFIRTKCQLLIYNRNLTDAIFTIEQQVNALNEDQIQTFPNHTYTCNK